MPKILLATTVTWSCAERLAGALTGAEIEAVAPARHAVLVSQHLHRAYRYRPLGAIASIRKAIAQAAPDLVIPCEDRAVALLAQIHAQGSKEERDLLERSLGKPDCYPDLHARQRFIAEAARAGAHVAPMLPAPDEAALARGIRHFGLPLVIKSDFSWGGEGVVVARSEAEALAGWHMLRRPPVRWRELARMVRRHDLHFLTSVLNPRRPVIGLQRFIPGRPATSSLLCWQGQVLAANHFDVEVSQSEQGPATVISRRDCAQMQDAARRVARHFGLSGLVGLDFIRDPKGQATLLEINPCATPTAHLMLGVGHDPCGALLEKLGAALAPRPAVTQSRQIALFPQEWRRAQDSPWLTRAFHDVPWNDPAVVQRMIGASPRRPAFRAGFNDDLSGEFAELLASPGMKEDLKALALTIRQSARQ